MTTKLSRTLAFLVLATALATTASAATFTVTLKNGTSFESRYPPEPADWDPNLMLLLTDRGNWIALENDDIVDVVSSAELNGFGYQLDTTTLFLGWSPNDLVNDEAGESGDQSEALYEADAPAGNSAYSMNQFLSFSGADPGATAGNIPLYVGGNNDE